MFRLLIDRWLSYVVGPFKINGVPLRRVNQSYVIGTSTKVDISCVNVEKFDDKYFAKEGEKKKKKGEGEFFEAEKEVKRLWFICFAICISFLGQVKWWNKPYIFLFCSLAYMMDVKI